jgi:hypothetical protein
MKLFILLNLLVSVVLIISYTWRMFNGWSDPLAWFGLFLCAYALAIQCMAFLREQKHE